MREELNNTIEHAQHERSLSALVIDVNEKRTNTAKQKQERRLDRHCVYT